MKKISAEQLYEAMEGIGDDLLVRSEQASEQNAGRRKTRTIRRVSFAVTALAAIVVLGIVSLGTLRMGKQESTMSAPAVASSVAADAMKQSRSDQESADEATVESVMPEEGIATAPMMAAEGAMEDDKEDAAADAGAGTRVQADMEAFFFLDGVRYVESERVPDDGTIAGDYAGTITKEIDEWNAEEITESGAGCVTGDLYLVNGRKKEEALCMIEEETGTVLIFEAVD